MRSLRLEGAVLVPKEGSPRVIGKPVLRSLSPLRPEVPLYLRPDAFAQAHAEANVGLVTSAVHELAPRETDSVLELYSGNGNFTFPLAASAASVLGVESSPVWVELAQRSAREGGVANVRFVQGDARKVCEGLIARGQAVRPVRWRILRGRGLRGSHAGIKALGVKRVVYVACDPALAGSGRGGAGGGGLQARWRSRWWTCSPRRTTWKP